MKETDLFVVQRPTGVDSGTYKVAASDIPANAVVSGTAPTDPMDGALWLDTNSDTLKTWDGSAWVEPPPGGVTQIVAGSNVTISPANGTGIVTVNSTGGGGGGGGSSTPVPQKVAYLRDERPSGTEGGSSVVGWQDRTLNTKEDANNLVVLSGNEFTLSAGEYQIEWSAPAFYSSKHQTKLTNVTDGVTQEMGSSGYTTAGNNSQTRSFGSTRIKITTDTTYKIEHYIAVNTTTYGLGNSVSSGEPEVYTQVTVTDLAIVGGTGTVANTNIYGTAKVRGIVNSGGAISLVGCTVSGNGDNTSRITFNTPQLNTNYEVVLGPIATTANVGSQVLNKTTTHFDIGVWNWSSGVYVADVVHFAVFDDTPVEVELTTFGDVINYSGPSAWGYSETATDTLLSGSNIASIKYDSATAGWKVTFSTPMPSANYAVFVTGDVNSGWQSSVQNALKTPTSFVVNFYNAGTVAVPPNINVVVYALNSLPPKGGTGIDAWGNYDEDGNILSSFNIASVARTNNGEYTVAFTTPMPTANYSIVGSSQEKNGTFITFEQKTTTGFVCIASNETATQYDTAISFQVNCTSATLPLTVTQDQIESAINNPGASAWGNVDTNGNLVNGINCSSTGAAGDIDITFLTPMPNANYAVTLGTSAYNSAIRNQTATGFKIITDIGGSDTTINSFTVHATNSLPIKGGTGTDSWGSVNATGTIRSSFNVASVTKTATGQYSVVFATPMPTGDYAINASPASSASSTPTVTPNNQTTAGFDVTIYTQTGGTWGISDLGFSFTVNATNATLPQSFTEAQAQKFLAFVNSGGLPPIAILQDRQTTNSSGTAGAAVWNDREFNTVDDVSNLVSLNANKTEFTLQPGTYSIEWFSLGLQCGRMVSRLTNVSANTTAGIGAAVYSNGTGDYTTAVSQGTARVQIASASTFKIEQNMQTNSAWNMGIALGAGTGEDSVFSQVTITGTPA